MRNIMLDESTERFLQEERKVVIELLLEELKERIMALPDEDRRSLCSDVFSELLKRDFGIPRFLRIAWSD